MSLSDNAFFEINVICFTNIDPWGPRLNSKIHIEPVKDLPKSIIEKHLHFIDNNEGVQETALSEIIDLSFFDPFLTPWDEMKISKSYCTSTGHGKSSPRIS